MPRLIWECEECQRTQEGGLRPPEGWCGISFWNGQRFVRFSFCSYQCAGAWCLKRYDKEPSKENNSNA